MTKPILFNTEMVRAILDGRKTVTRRVVKDIPLDAKCVFVCDDYVTFRWQVKAKNANIVFDKEEDVAPPYRPGDILYVRETYFKYAGEYVYKASAAQPEIWKGMWRPSIHMPREAARIWLRVTDVRVEQLQDSFTKHGGTIFEIRAEGINIPEECCDCIDAYGSPCCIDTTEDDGFECGMLDYSRSDFADLWDSTVRNIDRELYGWAANPWVWVIEFERCEKPEEVV